MQFRNCPAAVSSECPRRTKISHWPQGWEDCSARGNESEDLPHLFNNISLGDLVDKVSLGKMKQKGRILLLACLLTTTEMYAQQDTTTLKSVEVKSHIPSRNVSSSLPTQEMKRTDIQKLGMTSLADVLRRMAGTNTKDYGGLGGMKTVSVRNMGAAHTAIALDGIPVSNCQAGQVDIGRFSLRRLESVSLAVGQQEEMLQSARLYASGAVLSLKSLEPTFREGKKWSLDALCQAGSWGEFNPDLSWNQRLGEKTVLSTNIDFLRSDGHYPFSLEIPNVGTQHLKRKNSDIKQWHGEASLSHTFRKGGKLNLKAYGYQSDRGLPGHVVFYNDDKAHERLWDKNAFLQGSYRQQLNKQWSILGQAKYNYSWDRYRIEDESYTSGFSEDRNTQREGFLSTAIHYQPRSEWSFSLSQDGILNTLRGNMMHCPMPNRYTSLSAVNIRWQKPHWKLTGTLVNTFQKEDVKRGERPQDIEHLSPTLSVRLTPWDNQPIHFRTMYKNTFRTASFNDLYYQRLGNIHLKPEDAQQLSTGFTWAPYQVGILKKVSFTIDGYYGLISNKIVAIPTAYVWSMRNYGETRIGGIDATLHGTIPIGQRVHLQIDATYNWMKATDRTDSNSKSFGHQLPYTPPHSGNANLLLHTPWADVGYTILAVGKRYKEAQNIPANEVKAYQDHSLTLSREWVLKGCTLQLTGSITNLWNQNYDIIRYYPMPGRAGHLTMEIKL